MLLRVPELEARIVPCGCQGNRWNPDSDLIPAPVGPTASGYFWNGVEEDPPTQDSEQQASEQAADD